MSNGNILMLIWLWLLIVGVGLIWAILKYYFSQRKNKKTPEVTP